MHKALLLVCFLLAACGGRVRDEAAPGDASVDAITDSAALDTLPPRRDTAPPPIDLGPPPTGCSTPLPPSFACEEPTPIAGQRVCTDVMIQALVDGCFGSTATSSGCEAARKAHPACSRCALESWIVDGRLAIAECMQKIDPKNSCVKSIECTYDCLSEVCYNCETEEEIDDCYSREVDGLCAPYTSDYPVCAGDPKFSVCFPAELEDLLPFYRGACRDGGNWSRAHEPDAIDAGSVDAVPRD